MFLQPPFRTASSPQRIVSLVPSQTELLAYLGADEQTIAITKFCIHPEEWFRNKTRIGGTKNIDTLKIINLGPDLILSNKEENVKEQVELLAERCPVYMSDIRNYDDAIQMISDIGVLIHKKIEADKLIKCIREEFAKISNVERKIRSIYLIWKEPYMTVGGDSFISDMMDKAGFQNMFAPAERYPTLTIEAIRNLQPECILLSSEPYPFKEEHIAELQTELPSAKLLLADGEMFSWYGSRMLLVPAYFQKLRNTV